MDTDTTAKKTTSATPASKGEALHFENVMKMPSFNGGAMMMPSFEGCATKLPLFEGCATKIPLFEGCTMMMPSFEGGTMKIAAASCQLPAEEYKAMTAKPSLQEDTVSGCMLANDGDTMMMMILATTEAAAASART